MQQNSLVDKATQMFNYLISGGTPNATFTIPAGYYFKGVVSFQARINTDNIPCLMTVGIQASDILFWIQSQPSNPIDTLDTAGYASGVLLGPGTYATTWVSGPDSGATNYIAVVGMLFKL